LEGQEIQQNAYGGAEASSLAEFPLWRQALFHDLGWAPMQPIRRDPDAKNKA